MQDTPDSRTVVAAVNDLMFGSRIRGAAAQLGVDVTFVRSADSLRSAAAGARLILLDLETRWLDAPLVIRELKQDQATADVHIVAFGSHVNVAALTAARAAGADRAIARSAFVSVLPKLLQEATSQG